MRIKRIKLVNFIGVKHGMDKDVIELNFTDNPIVMLQGGNGSGKSTILSQLHPFTDSFDDRKDIILDEKDGLKEITIEHNGDVYEIQHHYPVKGNKKTFIQKNGVEMNDGGRFKEGMEIIQKEFNISSDYFKIGKIGSNTRNFVDLQAGNRKEYISKFLDIADLTTAHEVVKEKLKEQRTQLSVISKELKDFETKEILEVKIAEGEKIFKEADDIITENLPKKGSLEATLERAKRDIGTQDLKTVKTTFETLSKEYDQSIIDEATIRKNLNLTTDKKETQEKRDAIAADIAECETNIRVNNSEQNSLKLLLATQKNKADTNKLQIAGFDSNVEDLEKIRAQKESYLEEQTTIKEEIRASAVGKTVFDAVRAGKNVLDYIDKFKDMTDFIEKYFTNLMKSDTKKYSTNLELFLAEDCESILESMTTQTRTSLSEKRKLLEELRSERATKEANVCHLANLEKRPHECNIDSCPFIRDALKYKNVKNEILDIDLKINSVIKDIEAVELVADGLTETISESKLFNVNYGALNARDNIIYQFFLGDKSLLEKVGSNLSTFQLERQELIDTAKEIAEKIQYFGSLTKSIAALDNMINSKYQGDISLKAKFEEDQVELEKELANLEEQLKKKQDEGDVYSAELSNKRAILDEFDKYLTILSNRDNLATKKCNAKSLLEKLEEYTETKLTSEKELEVVNKLLDENIKIRDIKGTEINRLKVNLGSVINLTERFETLSKQSEPLEKVLTALDPKAGIPLIFIKLYLEETEAIANSLLDVAYNGDFNIKFNLGEKDFLIEVVAKDNVKEDIKLSSQGEMALTTISISLALIQQSIGDYNILCLDEIDGPLDAENRENFLNILNSQISKLGIEQVFVISHNNAFDTAAMDLVLLPRHSVDEENTEFMKNKNVIFRYDDITISETSE